MKQKSIIKKQISAVLNRFKSDLENYKIVYIDRISEKIKEFGKEKILSAPVFKVEELSNEGIFIQISENPFNSKFEEEEKLKELLLH